jgi:hypothetical protein
MKVSEKVPDYSAQACRLIFDIILSKLGRRDERQGTRVVPKLR